ncbi:MAG TPA: Chromate resistance protein ChrB, partial [Gemmatimonadaceae bacterium]|nr:Chromate resistance protein ChrB [Gemmatimonadaceae bacterium]
MTNRDVEQESSGRALWLLLIHQIPPKPDYLRVKIGRRLQRVGAVAVKNSVYVLPDRPASLEDFQWVRAEIIDGGGDASICQAGFVDGLTDDQIKHLFRGARDADYAELAEAARELAGVGRRQYRDAAQTRAARPDDELGRLRKRLASIVAIDFFSAPGRAMAEHTVRAAAHGLGVDEDRPFAASAGRIDRTGYRGRTWVTRAGVFVDRI